METLETVVLANIAASHNFTNQAPRLGTLLPLQLLPIQQRQPDIERVSSLVYQIEGNARRAKENRNQIVCSTKIMQESTKNKARLGTTAPCNQSPQHGSLQLLRLRPFPPRQPGI